MSEEICINDYKTEETAEDEIHFESCFNKKNERQDFFSFFPNWIVVMNPSLGFKWSVKSVSPENFLGRCNCQLFDPQIFSNFSSRVSCELLFSFLKNLLVHDMLFMHTLPFILSPERV